MIIPILQMRKLRLEEQFPNLKAKKELPKGRFWNKGIARTKIQASE